VLTSGECVHQLARVLNPFIGSVIQRRKMDEGETPERNRHSGNNRFTDISTGIGFGNSLVVETLVNVQTAVRHRPLGP
jgi:hypothetical protein